MSKLITCPSGLSGMIRGLPGKDLDVLMDKKAHRTGEFIDNLIRKCWVSTENPGLYETKNGSIDWKNVLSGDRFYVTLQIRCAVFGEEYSFQTKCDETRDCGKFEYSLNLTELPVKKLSDEDLATFRGGNRFEGEFDGRKFAFRLSTGVDEALAAKLGNKGRAIIQMVTSRIFEIEGIEEGKIRTFFEDEDMSVALKAMRAMNERDCGVETTVDVECPECGDIREVEIPFDQGFFTLSPEKKTKAPRE